MGGNLQTVDPEAITEDVGRSLFSSASGRRPSRGNCPRRRQIRRLFMVEGAALQGQAMEVGPLARVMVGYPTDRTPPEKRGGCLLKTLGREPGI